MHAATCSQDQTCSTPLLACLVHMSGTGAALAWVQQYQELGAAFLWRHLPYLATCSRICWVLGPSSGASMADCSAAYQLGCCCGYAQPVCCPPHPMGAKVWAYHKLAAGVRRMGRALVTSQVKFLRDIAGVPTSVAHKHPTA